MDWNHMRSPYNQVIQADQISWHCTKMKHQLCLLTWWLRTIFMTFYESWIQDISKHTCVYTRCHMFSIGCSYLGYYLSRIISCSLLVSKNQPCCHAEFIVLPETLKQVKNNIIPKQDFSPIKVTTYTFIGKTLLEVDWLSYTKIGCDQSQRITSDHLDAQKFLFWRWYASQCSSASRLGTFLAGSVVTTAPRGCILSILQDLLIILHNLRYFLAGA